jgi:hypothetical protein
MKEEFTQTQIDEMLRKFSITFNSAFFDPLLGIIFAEGDDPGRYIPSKIAFELASSSEIIDIDDACDKAIELPNDYF